MPQVAIEFGERKSREHCETKGREVGDMRSCDGQADENGEAPGEFTRFPALKTT